MTITSEIQRIKTNIENFYTACESKGATLPEDRNSNNLSSTINSIAGNVPTIINCVNNQTYTYDNPTPVIVSGSLNSANNSIGSSDVSFRDLTIDVSTKGGNSSFEWYGTNKVLFDNVTFTGNNTSNTNTFDSQGDENKGTKYIDMINCKFTPTREYIGINIGGCGAKVQSIYNPNFILAKKINMVGCVFDNLVSKPLTIDSVDDNCVINVKNCIFKSCPWLFRFSNGSLKSNITINIEDCIFTGYVNTDGLFLLQGLGNDQYEYGPRYGITINIKNLQIGNTAGNYFQPKSSQADYWTGSGSSRAGWIYIGDYLSYDATKFPTVNVDNS